MKVCEVFDSIQGEGIYMGLPTTFIRLSGCNLRCTWCDTKYAFEEGQEMSIEDIASKCNKKTVCITGGEPLIQDLDPLIRLLHRGNHLVHVETNGTIRPRVVTKWLVDFWTVSPKLSNSGMESHLNPAAVSYILDHTREAQLKFVIESKSDLEEAMVFSKLVMPVENKWPVVVQPQSFHTESLDEYLTHLRQIVSWVKEMELNWRVMPQLHRLLYGYERGK